MSKHKITGPMFFKETYANQSVKIIPAQLFDKITTKKNTGQSTVTGRYDR
jgi:hypothetical protein